VIAGDATQLIQDPSRNGSVRQPFERADAQEAVRAVEGIRSLVNDIIVTQAPSPAGFEAPEDRS
jgi:hypothetical protein